MNFYKIGKNLNIVLLRFSSWLATSLPKCDTNQVFSTCAPAPGCRITCANRNNFSPVCIDSCFKACVCRPGFIWNDEEKCVKPDQCKIDKKDIIKAFKCKSNEDFDECAIDSKCRKTCENRKNPPKNCDKSCRPDCLCKSGFVLNNDGNCIKADKCPKKVDNEDEKDEEEENDKDTVRSTVKTTKFTIPARTISPTTESTTPTTTTTTTIEPATTT